MRFLLPIARLKLFLQLTRESVYRIPSNNLKSIFGTWQDLIPPYHPWSEYNLFHLHHQSPFSVQTHLFLHLLLFVLEKTHHVEAVEALPDEANRLALQESLKALRNAPRSESGSKVFLSSLGKEFAGEQWLYINGVFTNQLVAAMHGNYLATLFGRKIKVIYHPTGGWIMDVLEGVRDRIFQTPSKTEAFAYEQVITHAKQPETNKVVLIAHSQGNLMTAGILKRMEREHPEYLDKMEVYTFANCANRMRSRLNRTGNLVPYFEHFANTKDIVGKVGILAEEAKKRGEVRLDGPLFIRNSWGHLLNTHYLQGIEKKAYNDPNHQRTPRLYAYLGGQSPESSSYEK